MSSAKRAGRLAGILLFVHLAVGLMLPYILLKPGFGEPGYLATAAGAAGQVRSAVVLFFMSGAIGVGIALVAFPVFRRASERMALLLVVLSAVNLAMHAVENTTLLWMLSLSQQYVRADAADAASLQAVGTAAGTLRRFVHFTHLLVLGGWMLALFGVLWRGALVPRALAAVALLASLLQISAVPLRAILGYPVVTLLAVPLAPVYLTIAVWLMVRGFAERDGLV